MGWGEVDGPRTPMRALLAEVRAQEALGFELAVLVALCEVDDVAV